MTAPSLSSLPSSLSGSDSGRQGAAEQRTSTGILRSVTEIPQQYRQLFSHFPYFNIVQSTVFQDVFYSDRSVVVSAPTGSGKTVVMELALVRLLSRPHHGSSSDHHPPLARVVYMAPLKAVVKERYLDWRQRLALLNLTCAEVTGDTEHDDISVIRNSQVVLTTPEKWDSLTRRWRDHASLMQAVSLLLIDEVHVLSDEGRGPTLEAVVSRMKTIRSTRPTSSSDDQHDTPRLRFVAVSATIPNVEDVAAWLSDEEGPAVSHRLEEGLRPVSLRRVVLGYDCRESWTEFRFDISLTYRLPSVIATYSNNKPSLVFVSTRKAAQTTAMTLMREARLVRDASHRQLLTSVGNSLRDNKLRECVLCGVGYHHAGLDASDRHQVEELFMASQLPVLVATSTLAMGVNLPAHLVVIKSTAQYVGGAYTEYSTTQLLQMMGRAGRPQFDDHATAVIMTKNQHKAKYENLVSGRSLLESHLHLHLVEHLNAEIVLGTVTDLGVAVEWLRSTFLYVRVQHNPRHYGLPQRLQHAQLEAKLQEMCMREVNALAQVGLIVLSEVDVKATPPGRLMARYCVSFTTMKTFIQLRGDESIRELVELLAGCREFWDIKVRTSEKRVLNELNKSPSSRIRFPIKGRIKTREHKINCLVQGTLGCQAIVDPGLSQEANKIMRTGQRITKCLAEYGATRPEYELQLNTTLLAKCFSSRLWENSRHVTRQLERIGPALSASFVHSKITSFSALEAVSPRDIELIVNRQPPFGNRIRDQAVRLPRYELTLEQLNQVRVESSEVRVTVRLVNYLELRGGATTPRHHSCRLILGDTNNNVVFHQRVTDAALVVCGSVTRVVNVGRAKAGDELAVNFISETWAGLDVQSCYSPRYLPRPHAPPQPTATPTPPPTAQGGGESSGGGGGAGPGDGARRACLHACVDKLTCAHNCCKVGVSAGHQGSSSRRGVPTVVQEIRKRASQLPATPKMRMSGSDTRKRFSKFRYSPHRPRLLLEPKQQAVSLASHDTSQPNADHSTNQPTANQNICQPIANQNIRQPTANQKICQPIANQDIRQLIANQNRQPVANQSISQSIVNQNKYQPIISESTRQPIVNQNIRQSNTKQNKLWPSANQMHASSNIRQCANPTVGTSKFISHHTHSGNQQQTEEIIDEEVWQEFENASNFEGDEWQEDFPDMETYMTEEEKETYPAGSAKEEENYDAFTEPLGMDDPDSSSGDLSAASWNQFQARQQQSRISCSQQSTSNLLTTSSLSKGHSGAPAAALNIGRKPPVSQSQPGQQGTELCGFEQEPDNTSVMQNVAEEQRPPWPPDGQNLHRQRPLRPTGVSTSQSILRLSGVQTNQNQMSLQVNQNQRSLYFFRAQAGQNKRSTQPSLSQANKVQRPLGTCGTQLNQIQRPLRPQGTQVNQIQRPLGSQGTQMNQIQRPLRPQGTQVNQIQRPLRPQGTQVNQIQRPIGSQGTQVNQIQRPFGSQGTQVNQIQRPLGSRGTQVNQIQRPSGSQGTQVNQIQRPLGSQGTQVNQIQRPLGSQGTQVNQIQRPLGSQGTQVNRIQRPLGSQGTQVNQIQRPLRPQGTQMNRIQRPLRPQGTQMNQIQRPMGFHGTHVNQIQVPLGPLEPPVSQVQKPLRPSVGQANQIPRPLRPTGQAGQSETSLTPLGGQTYQGEMRPFGAKGNRLQHSALPLHSQISRRLPDACNRESRPALSVFDNRYQMPSDVSDNESQWIEQPESQADRSGHQEPTLIANQSGYQIPIEASQVDQSGYQIPTLASQVDQSGYQMPTLASQVDQSGYQIQTLTSQINHSGYQAPTLTSQVDQSRYQIPTVASQIDQSGHQVPTHVNQVDQSGYQVPTFLASQATRPSVFKSQQDSSRTATSVASANLTTFELEDGQVSAGRDYRTYFTPQTVQGSWHAQSATGSNVVQQESIPSEVGFAASRYQSLVGNQVAPAQHNRLSYSHQNTGYMSFSNESVNQDWNTGQSHDHMNQSNGLPLQSSSQQAFPGISRALQHNKPVAGIKPLASTFGQSTSSKQKRVKDDPFSHLTKEWVEAQRGRTRGKLSNIIPTTQGPHSAVEGPIASMRTQSLDDDWRDLEMFQWCRQQERLALDSLYQKGQASAVDKVGEPQQHEVASLVGQTVPPSTYPARATGTQGDVTASPGSLHITYTSGERGPALGVGLTNVGGIQQNININLSSILNNARSTHRAPATNASRATNIQLNLEHDGATPGNDGVAFDLILRS